LIIVQQLRRDLEPRGSKIVNDKAVLAFSPKQAFSTEISGEVS
jgi:hypothetical protein